MLYLKINHVSKVLKVFAFIYMFGFIFAPLKIKAFNPEEDGYKYERIIGTNIYIDETSSQKEIDDVVSNWKLLPDNMKEMMYKYGIKLFLIGDNETVILPTQSQDSFIPVIDENSPNLIPYENPYDPDGPEFIEKDPYDLNNLKVVKYSGKDKLLFHGYYLDYNEDVDMEKMKQLYLESAPYFGINYFTNNSDEEEEKEVSSIACATSWGPSVKYDSFNNYKFVEYVKYGYTEYYSNNKAYIPESIIHEVGHHLDWMSVPLSGYYNNTLFGISDSKEWKDLYEKYKEVLVKIDNVSLHNVYLSPSEGFADAFRLCIQYPSKMKEVCPDVYNYVVSCIQQYGINKEGTLESFDHVYYSDMYPDLNAAFGYDKEALYNHYLIYGMKEHRLVRFL